jgi:hypothetical protein
MTCDECEQILLNPSPGINGMGWMPGVSVTNLAKSHAQNCPACAAKMFEAAKLNEALDQLRGSTMQAEAPAAVETNLLAAFRREMARRRPSVDRAFPWKLGWAVAAVLLLVPAGSILYSWLSPRSPVAVQTERNPGEHRSENQPLPKPPGTSKRALVESHHTSTHSESASSRANGAKPGKRTRERSVTQSQVPVGDELSLNGGGSIVRVTLPLSSLVAMGVPVRPDISDPRVTADVMMDPFGAVMGIRLVEAKPSVN